MTKSCMKNQDSVLYKKDEKDTNYYFVINYLKDLLPPLVSLQSPYHRRRPLDRIVPASKTEIHASSFFPSATRLWNKLLENIQASSSISAFKRYISSSYPIVPTYFY